MAIRLQTEVKGLKELRRGLKDNRLISEPYRNAALAIGALGERVAAQSAPRGKTGQLEAQITHRVQKKPIPLWIAVASRARRRSRKYPRGYPYGRLLNYSRKHGHRGWFTNPLRRLSSKVGPVLAQAARDFENQFVRLSR